MSDIRLFYSDAKRAKERAARAIGRAADLEFRAMVGEPIERSLGKAIKKREQAIHNYERAEDNYITALEHPEFFS